MAPSTNIDRIAKPDGRPLQLATFERRRGSAAIRAKWKNSARSNPEARDRGGIGCNPSPHDSLVPRGVGTAWPTKTKTKSVVSKVHQRISSSGDKRRHERRTVLWNVSGVRKLPGTSARPITNRPQVANLPHVISKT